MSDLRELYQEVILDHNRSPRNRGALADANRRAEGHNPLCGDRVAVFVRVAGDTIEEVRFDGEGCAISTAAASLMTQMLKGKTVAEAKRIFEAYQRMVTGGATDAGLLEKLAVFRGVREFPMRVKCATLAWHTLEAALDRHEDPVTTE